MLFLKGQQIGNYRITFPIQERTTAECYRAKDSSGKNCFVKILNFAQLHRSQYDEDGDVLELNISRQLNHSNIVHYCDGGSLLHEGKKLQYIVFDFISGETIAQQLVREHDLRVHDAKQILAGVLNGLKYLHTLPRPIIHNAVCAQNVMLDLKSSTISPRIIDFGHARYLDQSRKDWLDEGVNPFYTAPELFNGTFTVSSDIYAVGALLYHMLFGMPPHFIDLSPYQQSRTRLNDVVCEELKRPLRIPNIDKFELDDELLNIIAKALAFDPQDRFESVHEFIQALNGEIDVAPHIARTKVTSDHSPDRHAAIKRGNGFADVAGMENLKERLRNDVIAVLNDPEGAKALGLHMPNGMLFYGPPGCGKTFFAQKFAEETDFNYIYVSCSDVASPYIHGGQEKIASLFEEARKNAPTILFLDEIDALITDRSRHTNVSEQGEVNEFLTQLNNCGETGVIVIGATNKPDMIDSAALRAGRLESKYYIPQPDFETRKSLFELQLKNRKTDLGIDYDELALKTENFISDDIRLIVDKAAREAFRQHTGKITMEALREVIKTSRPTVSLEEIRRHEAMRDQMEQASEPQRKRIGFN